MRKCLTVALALSLCGLAYGHVWPEVGDAGELSGTAQIPAGSGPLTTITGNRGPDAQMYLINIPEPAALLLLGPGGLALIRRR